MNSELSVTLTSLQSRGCHVSREWLTDCINFFRSENNRYSPSELQNFVFEQWLLGDLCEIAGFGSFPPNLKDTIKTTLHGKMACQLQYVSDIGHSAYTQMQKVRNEDVGNSLVDENAKEFQQAWEPKANRMLQLVLCDGSQTLKGIEYRPISALKADMIPGTKILIKGPVLCRRGILMLEERHVENLGGEVESLVIVNAYENVLARILQLPENPDPYKMTAVADDLPVHRPANPQQCQQNEVQATSLQIAVPPVQPNNIQQRMRYPTQPSDVSGGGLPATSSGQPKKMVQPTLSWAKQAQQPAKTNKSRSPQPQPADFTISDTDLMNIPLRADDWETEMKCDNNSENFQNNDNVISRNKSTRPLSFNVSARKDTFLNPRNDTQSSVSAFTDDYDMESDDEAMLLQAEADLALINVELEPTFNPQNTSDKSNTKSTTGKERAETSAVKRPASSALSEETLRKPLFAKRRKETLSQEVSSTSDLNFLIDDDFLNASDIPLESSQISSSPLEMSAHPFVYLSQIINEKYEYSVTFRVKAAVITIVEKLTISDNEWKLTAQISDGSAKLNVLLSSKVLENLIGISPTVMQQKKRDISNAAVKNEIRQVLQNAQRRFIHLNCLLDIKMGCDQHLPVVVGLEEISSSTVSALKSRQYVF